ncbi:glycosyltransferase family 9 protein [Vibrio sp. LaRot3]|uniref:glycosyltransferase family 9 protein n=1 Tax=Vibrio sp. LaRot3 TaxID=2998829 RepID=UPI0022CE0C59|nr:glycosyltransferase family 9 protein [Vibrio sp. LaRot3]MDA0149382.1 hypothetical protein [Vibrio sp. LaRot3]
MHKWIMRGRTFGQVEDHFIKSSDAENAKTVVFSLFGRFGDSLIGLATIRKYLDKHTHLTPTIVTTSHFRPYVKTVLPKANTITISKRNPIDLIYKTYWLKRNNFDIGFNPYSWSEESEYYISFAKKFSFFKSFTGQGEYDFLENYYLKAKRYLGLEFSRQKINSLVLSNKGYSRILICPESSETKRTVNPKSLFLVVDELRKKFNPESITIAASTEAYKIASCDFFKFYKTEQSSEAFSQLTISSGLMVCVDSGPLHLAMAINKPVIALFGGSLPESVVDQDFSKIQVIHNKALQNIYCLRKSCDDPKCFNDLFVDGFLDLEYEASDLKLSRGSMECEYK